MDNQDIQPARAGLLLGEDLSDINFPLLNLWIRTCEKEHEKFCGLKFLSIAQKMGNTFKPFEIILIDVSQRCLVKSTTKARFLALSYVWGGVPQLVLSKQNWDLLSKPGSLSQSLWSEAIPAVIQDAIQVTAKLKERFLWVDSLCIFQDDADSKHDQISNMNRIFQEATVTLLAVAGETANDGLPGVKAGTRSSSDERCDSPTINTAKLVLTRLKGPDSKEVLRSINKSTYASRGWIFQERLLSRRCIIFLQDQVYFQCQSELFCEKDTPVGLRAKTTNPLIINTMNTLCQIHNNDEEEFSIYAQLVCEYSWKQLSYPEDAVNAFSGILSIMENNFGWKFVDGMPIEPKEAFERALFWVPYHRAVSKLERKEGITSNAFPTWSWAGCSAGVDFWPVLRPRTTNHPFAEPPPETKTLVSHISDFKVLTPESISVREVPSSSFDSPGMELRKLTSIFERTRRRLRRSPQLVDKVYPLLRPVPTLRFMANITQASHFDFEVSHPWKAKGFLYITPDCDALPGREGMWIISKEQARDAGFLYGISSDDLESLDKDALVFACLSETSFGTVSGTMIPDDPDRLFNWAHREENWSSQAFREWMNPSGCYVVPRMLLNVLLLYRTGTQMYERVAAGQIDKSTWDGVPKRKQNIQLQ